jgi:hypothetical protein
MNVNYSCSPMFLECVYDASRPKRRLDSKYIQSLERDVARLKHALEAAERNSAGAVCLENRKHYHKADKAISQPELSPSNVTTSDSYRSPEVDSFHKDQDPTVLLETMVEATGSLDIDESGNCDYNGSSAGLIMIRRIRERCDSLLEGSSKPSPLSKSAPYHSLTTPASSPGEFSEARTRPGLPPKDVAVEYVRRVFDFVFPLIHFLHRPSFSDLFERFYASRLNQDYEDARFKALLYEIFALGELFSPHSQLEISRGQTPLLA